MKKEVQDLIKVRAASESQGVHARLKPLTPGFAPPMPQSATAGPRISGADLAKIQPIIDEIDDPALRNQTRSWFSMASKYKALEIITSDRCEIARRYPKIVERIAETATEADRAAITQRKESFQGNGT